MISLTSYSLHDVGQHRYGYEEPGDVVEDECGDVGVWVLEGVPHPLADGWTGDRRCTGGLAVSVLTAAACQLGVGSLPVLGADLLGILALTVAVLLVTAVGHALRQDAEELEKSIRPST